MKTLQPVYPTYPFERINQMMEEAFEGPLDYAFAPWNPPVDIVETDKEYRFYFELPGWVRENIKVEFQGNILYIWGKRTPPEAIVDGHYIRRERFYGEFKRYFKLEYPVVAKSVKAEFKSGLLSVFVSKLEASMPEKFEVTF